MLEGDLDILRLVGCRFGSDSAAKDVFLRLDPRVFEHLTLGRNVQQVSVDRKRRLAALVLGDRDLMLLGIIEEAGARIQIPLAPGCYDLDVRGECVIAELEADLVVALAGGTMGDGIGADPMGDLDLALGDQWTRDRGAEQIGALIESVGAKHREDEVAHELFAQIVDKDLAGAEQLGLTARRFELLALAEIGGEGDNLAAIGLLKPAQNDRGVEPARIGEHYLLHRLGHDLVPFRSPVREVLSSHVARERSMFGRTRVLPGRLRLACWRYRVAAQPPATTFDGTYRRVRTSEVTY